MLRIYLAVLYVLKKSRTIERNKLLIKKGGVSTSSRHQEVCGMTEHLTLNQCPSRVLSKKKTNNLERRRMRKAWNRSST